MEMDYEKALFVLEISLKPGYKLELKDLKKQYHKLALLNHPDKNNNSPESNEKFKQIHESYLFLKRELSFINYINVEKANEREQEQDQESINKNYVNILKSFIENIIQELCKGEKEYKEIIKRVVGDIVSGCEKISLKLFDNLSKEAAIDVYGFLSKYKTILHISQETLEEIKHIIKEKCKNDQIYVLNPSIDDLLNNNIYKLVVDGEIYYVPLWYDNVCFDKKDGSEIIVDCIPELPDNMYIEENGDIVVNIDISFTYSLFEQKSIPVLIGKKSIEIPINELYIRRTQTYNFYGLGISEMNEKNIYEICNKSSIICKINFVYDSDCK